MDTKVIRVDMSKRRVADITGDLEVFCGGKGDGLCSVFAPHATAGVGLMELGSGSETDLDEVLERLLPRDERYRHRHGSTGHGADHLLPVFVSPSVVLPVVDGHAQLGTWQRLVLIDTNSDNPVRQVRLSFVSG